MKTLFVSSTFRDMHAERDAIQKIVAPVLNAEAKKYGQTISFCDLRWGINTLDLDSADGSRKVLDVCLDQIDRCSPPMIILLGERYGYIPDRKIIGSVVKNKDIELSELELSVTALEIEYGVLSREQKSNTLFYFREMKNPPREFRCEDARHAAKLADLKSRIRKLAGDKLRTYSVDYAVGFDERAFSDMLIEDVRAILLPEWERAARLSAFERERNTQWSFIEDRSAICRGRDAFIDKLIAEIDGGSSLVTVKGVAGSGKSVVFSKLVTTLRDLGVDVLPFVGGLTVESNDALDVIRNTAAYLEYKLHGTPPDDYIAACAELKGGEWRDRYNKLIAEYIGKGNRFVIALDAVDQLFSDEYRRTLAFIPELANPKNFCFFATVNESFSALDAGCITLTKLARAEKVEVVKGALTRYGRELDSAVIDEMVSLRGSDSPLYLGFLIKRLLMMNSRDFEIIGDMGGQMDAISARQRQIIAECPRSVDAMCALLLGEAAKRINEALVRDVLDLLACSRFGLRERDLCALTAPKWDTLDFAHFIAYMGDCFILRDDGRYDFSHKSIRQGLRAAADVKAVNARIVEYFRSIPDDDICRSEMIYHMVQADDKDGFRAFINGLWSSDADLRDAEALARLVAYLESVCEFADGADQWFADVIVQTPISKDMTSFITLMCGVAMKFVALAVNVNAGLIICRALEKVIDRFVERNIEGAENMRYALQVILGQAEIFTGVDASGRFTETLEKVEQRYRADPSDANLAAYLVIARGRLGTSTRENTTEQDILDIIGVFDELADAARKRFAEEKTSVTLRNLYCVLVTKALTDYVTQEYDSALSCIDEAYAAAHKHYSLLTGLANVSDYNSMIEMNNSLGIMVVGSVGDDQFKELEDELAADDLDDEEDEFDFDDDDFDDDADDYELDEGDADDLEDENDVEEDYDDEEDDEGYEFDGDDVFAKTLRREALNGIALDDEGEDDGGADPVRQQKLMIAEMVWNATAELSEHFAELAGNEQFKIAKCNAYKQLGAISSLRGDDKRARRYYEEALAETNRLLKIEYSSEMRMLAHSIRALLITEYMNDENYELSLSTARDVVRDAENMTATDRSILAVNTLAEAYSAIIVVLMNKLEADEEDGAANKAEARELLDYCDRLKDIQDKSPSIGSSFTQIMFYAREIAYDILD